MVEPNINVCFYLSSDTNFSRILIFYAVFRKSYMKAKQDISLWWVLLFLIFSGIFLLWGIGDVALIDWDENIYAEASRQMMIRGDYLNVFMNGHLFFEKPPFFLWEQALSFNIFGVNEFAARFPSCIAGILILVLFIWFGKQIETMRLGLIWAAVYLSSFLPSILARTAFIDHTFNLFIATATLLLYTFDIKYKNYCNRQTDDIAKRAPKVNYLWYLTLASICLGLAVLTKGPTGGIIPLVGFVAYKIGNRDPTINICHFIYCAIISLLIASSWYLVNYFVNGPVFINGFSHFIIALFTKPLEGHSGPFYYHFVIVLFGLVPWTPFLFAFKINRHFKENSNFNAVTLICIAWIGFVLVLFSIVSTKLPHYSASTYIPLTFLIALNLYQAMKKKLAFPKWVIVFYFILGCGFAMVLIVLPDMANKYIAEQGAVFNYNWSNHTIGFGIILIILNILGGTLFLLKKTKIAVILTVIGMLIFTQGLWRLYLPPFLKFAQEPLIEMVNESHKKDGEVVLYRILSFAAMFYGQKEIKILHNYKFPSHPIILNSRHAKDVYIITNLSNKTRLKKEHPLVNFIKDKGQFSLFMLKKNR